MIGHGDREHLGSMVQFAEEAISFLGGDGARQLASDRKTLRAVSYALLAVGEAASRVSAEARSGIPAINWVQAIGMRHHLAHGYDVIRVEVIAETVRDDLPGLIAAIHNVLGKDTP